MEGSTQTQLDYKAMAPEQLVREANQVFDEVKGNQGLPGPHIIERLEPIWLAMTERIEAIGTG